MPQLLSSRTLLGLALLVAVFSAVNRYFQCPWQQRASSPRLQKVPASTSPPLQMASLSGRAPAVIVVGSGLAGLSAAFWALRSGAPAVVLLERATKPGGNSIKASSGINGAPTRFQHEVPPDTTFFSDTVKSAGTRFKLLATEQPWREDLIALLTHSSAAAVDFLADDVGVDLRIVAQLGGHSAARTHRGAGKTPPGADIVMKLLARLQQDNRFELRTGCEVTKLLTAQLGKAHVNGGTDSETDGDRDDNRVVTGVEYRSVGPTVSIIGPVVFATGGFAGDATGMLADYRPDLAGLPSTNVPRPGMHHLLTAVGAQLVDMDSVQIHPTGFVDPADPLLPMKFLAAEMLRGEGGILLRNGKRFVNELGTREHVSRAIMHGAPHTNYTGNSGYPTQWDVQLLLDPGASEAAAHHIAFYAWKGLLVTKKVADLDDTTRETIHSYSRVVAGEQRDEFGRTAFGRWRLRDGVEDNTQDVYIGSVTPVTHFTMGGVGISKKSEVLSSRLNSQPQVPISGLWAAGEVTGGIHGDNRLGGSSLLECAVFGRIAGEQAAAYLAAGER